MNGILISEYDNMRKASLETGISDSCIRYNCKGKYKSAGSYTWKYKSDI